MTIRSGYRVITTTYTFYLYKEDAKAAALKGRGEGKRTEIITEDEYSERLPSLGSMQDLTKI